MMEPAPSLKCETARNTAKFNCVQPRVGFFSGPLPNQSIDGFILILRPSMQTAFEEVFITQIFKDGENGISNSPGKRMAMFIIRGSHG